MEGLRQGDTDPSGLIGCPAMKVCSHLEEINTVTTGAEGCEVCLALGAAWVHLRICMSCGFVGCCDDSPGRHATKHFEETSHPVIRSAEPNEEWMFCYPH